ncbi:MAG: hypothetical protein O3A53_21170 [Acidobacteria bacterium]|nr:hypothetical protein [Acidobacteriota bacterium]MDA1237285.1 hypothetical protein [Acidobacteriota bacterium]
MPHPLDQPFPTQTSNQPLETQFGVLAMWEYLREFERRRNERPDRKFADVDVT